MRLGITNSGYFQNIENIISRIFSIMTSILKSKNQPKYFSDIF